MLPLESSQEDYEEKHRAQTWIEGQARMGGQHSPHLRPEHERRLREFQPGLSLDDRQGTQPSSQALMKGSGFAALSNAAPAGLLAGALLLLGGAVPAQAANPSMSSDFSAMMGWLSQEMAQGLAFNAGSTFDPPHEVKSRRLQPDISFGAGRMSLDKKKFPEPQTPALKELNAAKIFPSAVLFPNLAMHLRAGLPGRMDFSIRLANMTTPPGYKLAGGVAAKGQSNSIGFGLRRHFFGREGAPLLGLGANFNHVAGNFHLKTRFSVNTVQGFSADSDVNGDFRWNVSSFGLNAMLSQNYGVWTPFFGLGCNYSAGSVSTQLDATPNTPLISPIRGLASSHPEQNQARLIIGTQMNRSWINLFANGEVQAVGQHAGQSWIVHTGVSLPFEVGWKGFYSAKKGVRSKPTSSNARPEFAKRSKGRQSDPVFVPVAAETQPTLIFIQ